jgi:Ser-tRNA(Ala) deacylase AlaX
MPPSSTRAFYHEHPGTLTLQTDAIDARPGRVLLAQSPFFPGGGGQLSDRGVFRWKHGELRKETLSRGERDPGARASGVDQALSITSLTVS